MTLDAQREFQGRGMEQRPPVGREVMALRRRRYAAANQRPRGASMGGALGAPWWACGTYSTPPAIVRAARRARVTASKTGGHSGPRAVVPSTHRPALRDIPGGAHVGRNDPLAAWCLVRTLPTQGASL
jgi:hypothetical protein